MGWYKCQEIVKPSCLGIDGVGGEAKACILHAVSYRLGQRMGGFACTESLVWPCDAVANSILVNRIPSLDIPPPR